MKGQAAATSFGVVNPKQVPCTSPNNGLQLASSFMSWCGVDVEIEGEVWWGWLGCEGWWGPGASTDPRLETFPVGSSVRADSFGLTRCRRLRLKPRSVADRPDPSTWPPVKLA